MGVKSLLRIGDKLGWLGVLMGIVLDIGSRAFAPEEERVQSKTFGPAWDGYLQ